MQQPLTPRDFATFERIALTPRQCPLALDLHPRVATPRTRKARRIGLVLRVACQKVQTEAGPTTPTGAAGLRRLAQPGLPGAERPFAGNRHENDGEGERCLGSGG